MEKKSNTKGTYKGNPWFPFEPSFTCEGIISWYKPAMEWFFHYLKGTQVPF